MKKTRIQTVTVADLQAGDWILPPRIRVQAIDQFVTVAIVEFSDGTASAPLPLSMRVQIMRPASQKNPQPAHA